jgi:hypothetical protein
VATRDGTCFAPGFWTGNGLKKIGKMGKWKLGLIEEEGGMGFGTGFLFSHPLPVFFRPVLSKC